MNPTDRPSAPARRHRALRAVIRLCVASCVIMAAAAALAHRGPALLVAPAVGIVSGLLYLWVTRGRR